MNLWGVAGAFLNYAQWPACVTISIASAPAIVSAAVLQWPQKEPSAAQRLPE